MFWRFLFTLIALFWVTMNILLWRVEYGTGRDIGSPVPVEMVWKKILDSPDDSALNITRRGNHIGFCHLRTSVGEKLSKLDEAPQNGVSIKVNRILFDGSLAMKEKVRRLRFDGELLLSADRDWEQFDLRVMHRPVEIEVHSIAAERTVQVSATDGEYDFERAFKFSEFQNPTALLGELVGPFAEGLVGGFDLSALTKSSERTPTLLNWEARTDTLMIGHEPVRVYHLQTRIADRYNVAIFVSHAGEILKAELPDGIALVHEKLGNY